MLSIVPQTPKAPSSPKRKSFERKFPDSAPKRALLEYPVTGEAGGGGGAGACMWLPLGIKLQHWWLCMPVLVRIKWLKWPPIAEQTSTATEVDACIALLC
jgi:hypothetical protein